MKEFAGWHDRNRLQQLAIAGGVSDLRLLPVYEVAGAFLAYRSCLWRGRRLGRIEVGRSDARPEP
jgi:hypothetical protein